jgi:hypothetical protein
VTLEEIVLGDDVIDHAWVEGKQHFAFVLVAAAFALLFLLLLLGLVQFFFL